MSLAHPDLLWLFLAAVPVVILHLVRRRRKHSTVSSLILWQEVVATAPRRFGAGVLEALVSLLLVLSALGAAVLAAAGPSVGAPAPPPRPLLIAVGASARMEGERWARAVRLAEAEIDRKAAFDPLTLLLVSDRPRILAAGTTDAEAARAALRSAGPSLVRQGWELAGPALDDVVRGGGRAVAIGVRPEVPDGVAVLPVGGKNAGITDFAIEVRGDSIEVFLRAAGAAPGSDVTVSTSGQDARRFPVEPEMLFSLPRGPGGLAGVTLIGAGGPAFDDVVMARIPAPARLSVGVSSEVAADPFLRAALTASGVATTEGEPFDVRIVAGRDAPDPLPAGDWILIGPPPLSLGFERLPAAEASPIWDTAADHPVTRGVDAAEVEVMGAIPARVPADATPLLGLPGGAVAAAGERNGARYVWIGLDPENSTLPVTGAYPLLVRNALLWFASLRTLPMPLAVRAGEPVRPAVRLPDGIRAVALRGPAESDREIVEVEGGTFAYRPKSIGEGTVGARIGSVEHLTEVNVILPEETAVVPLEGEPVLGPDRSQLADTTRELWRWLVLAAATLLLLHWTLRRWVR